MSIMTSSRSFVLILWLYLSLATSCLPFPSSAPAKSSPKVPSSTSPNSAVPLPKTAHGTPKPLVYTRQTFYRIISEGEIDWNKINDSPTKFDKRRGDFSNKGGYYMFPLRSVALDYADGRKRAVKLLTLSWNPPAHLEAKSFAPADAENVDSDWYKLVKYSWNHTPDEALSPLSAPVVEGPLTTVNMAKDGTIVPETSAAEVDGKHITQVAILDATLLKHLTVEKSEDINCPTFKDMAINGAITALIATCSMLERVGQVFS